MKRKQIILSTLTTGILAFVIGLYTGLFIADEQQDETYLYNEKPEEELMSDRQFETADENSENIKDVALSKEDILEDCQTYAKEDMIPADKVEEYIAACVKELFAEYNEGAKQATDSSELSPEDERQSAVPPVPAEEPSMVK